MSEGNFSLKRSGNCLHDPTHMVPSLVQIYSANSFELRTVEGDSPSNGESKRDRYLKSWYEDTE